MNIKVFDDSDFKKNGFGYIRYYAAFAVMLGHYAWKTAEISSCGIEYMFFLKGAANLFPGVVILFSLSGYLVSASCEHSGSVKKYLIKRVLRLYPELWICTLVNLLILCILAKELIDYRMIIWLITQIFGIANTPGCLDTFATGSVNGALWTVFTEIQLYVVLCLIYGYLKRLSNKQWICLIFSSAAVNILCDLTISDSTIFGKIVERTFIPYFVWFLIGAFCYQKRKLVIPWLKKLLVLLLTAYGALNFLLPVMPGYYTSIQVSLLCPFIVIGMGYCLPPIKIKTDITYGIFLYHWIVLNVMIHFNLVNRWSWLVCLLVFVVSTVILAGLSKWVTEKIMEKINVDRLYLG